MQQHPPFMIIMDYAYAARTNLKTLTQLLHKVFIRGTQRRFPPKYIENTF